MNEILAHEIFFLMVLLRVLVCHREPSKGRGDLILDCFPCVLLSQDSSTIAMTLRKNLSQIFGAVAGDETGAKSILIDPYKKPV
jgi:hypothetical protein